MLQNLKLAVLVLFSVLLLFNKAIAAGYEVRLDTSFSKEILNEVCSGKELDIKAIEESPTVKDMLSHFVKFRPYFTMDNYTAARQNAANCKKDSDDYFRFNQLIDEKEQISTELAHLESLNPDAIEKIIANYAPLLDSSDKFEAVVMSGTPSCGGWSSSTKFYVDLPCIQQDREGLLYLIAHETYHLLQNKFMNLNTYKSLEEKFLLDIIIEGSAVHVADISKIKQPGEYTKKGLAALKKNERRMQYNFDLFDALLNQLTTNPSEKKYQQVYNIGLSGAFDSPLYSVGAHIVQTVEKTKGRQFLTCLLKNNPLALFGEYDAFPSTQSDYALGFVTSKIAKKYGQHNCSN